MYYFIISFIEELLRNNEHEYTLHFIIFYSEKFKLDIFKKKLYLCISKVLILISNSLITILAKFQK